MVGQLVSNLRSNSKAYSALCEVERTRLGQGRRFLGRLGRGRYRIKDHWLQLRNIKDGDDPRVEARQDGKFKVSHCCKVEVSVTIEI